MTLPWNIILFVLGLVAGAGLMVADATTLWRFYQSYVSSNGKKMMLTRALLFLIAYWPLAIFVVTTATNTFGQGVILAMGAVIGWEMWQRHQNPEAFKEYFGIAQSSRLTLQEIKIGTYIWMMVILLLTAATLL